MPVVASSAIERATGWHAGYRAAPCRQSGRRDSASSPVHVGSMSSASLQIAGASLTSTPRQVAARFKPESDARLKKREADLATREMYLTNFWYAAGFSDKIKPGHFYNTKLLDTPVLLWREKKSGVVRCITDKSPFTGQPISKSFRLCSGVNCKTRGHAELIRVDGHAMFNPQSGALVSMDADPTLASGRLEVWDCVEKGGFVWLFFGDKDMPMDLRPPIPWVPELNEPGWRAVHGEVMIKANHWMVIENVIDMAHVPYVHKGTVGNHAAFVDIEIEMEPTAMHFAFPIENHRKDGEKAALRVDTRATACLPSTSFIRFKFPWNLRLVTINSIVPIDEETTCIRFCQMRNFIRTGVFDPLIRQGMSNILGEDKVILEQLRPHEVANEISLKADAPQLQLRKMRQEFISAGSAVAPGLRPLHALPKWSQKVA